MKNRGKLFFGRVLREAPPACVIRGAIAARVLVFARLNSAVGQANAEEYVGLYFIFLWPEWERAARTGAAERRLAGAGRPTEAPANA